MEETRQIDSIGTLKEKFKDGILEFYEKSGKRYYILIDPGSLLPFVDYIFNVLKARYQIISALDTPNGMEILYHFALDRLGKVVSLRILLPHDKLEVESISPIITGAQWIEREISEILGIRFLNHPDPRKFLLSDDWPEGFHPYRRKK